MKDYLWVDLIVVLSEIKMIITDANLYHGCSIELVRGDTDTGKDWKTTNAKLEGTSAKMKACVLTSPPPGEIM